LPLAVSTVSLTVSGATFYSNTVAPFDPVITIGNIVWHPANAPVPEGFAPPPTEGGKVTKTLALLLPFTVTHAGGLPGVVEDIVIQLTQLSGKSRWLFVPQVLVDERAYFTTFEATGHLKWLIAPFAPLALSKGGQVERFVMFSSVSSPRYAGGTLSEGRYSIRVLAKVAGHDTYDEVSSRVETLGQQFIAQLLQGERWSTTPNTVELARSGIQ